MTSIEKKEAELQLFEFIYDELENKDHIYFAELEKKLVLEEPSVFKYFQCEYCIKASISKFPDCFYVSKLKDTVLLTSVANVRKGYYSHYMNCARIGSVVTEVVTLCTALIAKLELYNYLVQTLKINRVVLFNTLLTEIAKCSEHCRQYFKCKHVILEALEEFSDIFQLNPVGFQTYLDEATWITANYVLDCEENSLGTIFNCDKLLDVTVTTFLQLSAELQLYEISKEKTVPPSCIPINELVEIVLRSSRPCREYMPSRAMVKSVLSLFPDIFYISKRNRLLQRQCVNLPADDWYNVNRPNIELFDELLFKLKEVFLKELATFKLVEIANTQLKEHKHTSLANLTSLSRQNGYCRRYFNQFDNIKSIISSFSGIFHISRQKNIHLLQNEWANPSVRQMHNTISSSLLCIVMRSCKAILSEIHMYCFLIYNYCYGLPDNQPVSLQALLNEISSESSACKQIFTSMQQLKNSVQNYPSRFKIYQEHQVYVIEGEHEDSSSTDSAPSSSTASFQSSDITVTSNEEYAAQVDHLRNSPCTNKRFSQTLQPDAERINLTFPAKLASGQNNVNNHVSAFHNEASSDNLLPSTIECVSWGTEKTITETGTMNALLKTEGFILLQHSGITIPTIVDVVYDSGVKVSSLFDIDQKIVTCIAIGEEGSTQLNWKAVLVWIGIKPKSLNCVTGSKDAWESIKSLYEQRFKNNTAFVPASVNLDSCEIIKLNDTDLSPTKDLKNASQLTNKEEKLNIQEQQNFCKYPNENILSKPKMQSCSAQNNIDFENINSDIAIQCDKSFLTESISRRLKYEIDRNPEILKLSTDPDSTTEHKYCAYSVNETMSFLQPVKKSIRHVAQHNILVLKENYITFNEQTDGFCHQNNSDINTYSKKKEFQPENSVSNIDHIDKNKIVQNHGSEEVVINKSLDRTGGTMSRQQNTLIEIYSTEDNETQHSDAIVDLISNDSKRYKYVCCCII